MKRSELKQLIKEEIQKTLNENELINKFKKWVNSDKVTSIDIDFYASENKLTPEQKSLLEKTFLNSDFSIKSTGPAPDIRFRFMNR